MLIKSSVKKWSTGFCTALIPSLASANLVWPALYAEAKVSSLPIILLSLVLEFFVIRVLFHRSVKVSALMTVAANIVSGLAGLFLRPLSGIVWEVSLGELVQQMFDWGTFNPIAWFFVPILGGGLNAFLELAVLGLIWKENFSLKNFFCLWAVNCFTVGIATTWAVISLHFS